MKKEEGKDISEEDLGLIKKIKLWELFVVIFKFMNIIFILL